MTPGSSWLLVILFLSGCASHPPGHKGRQGYTDTSQDLAIPFYPLQSEKDLDPLIEAIGRSRIVLLGEASHGTADYYTWRSAITQRLIREKGFHMIAVEGDWSEISRINEFIRGEKKERQELIDLLHQNRRWPDWLWANEEIIPLLQWLNEDNQQRSRGKTGIYGLDIFSITGSAENIKRFTKDSMVRKRAGEVKQCFGRYGGNALTYAGEVNKSFSCQGPSVALWEEVQREASRVPEKEDRFLLLQNASVVLDGEHYFRTMASDRVTSWNIRDRHMMDIIRRLLKYYGKHSGLVVWAHNTHVGDAHFTEMLRGRTNIGELMRQEYGEKNVFIVGFGSYRGEVTTSESWGGPVRKTEVPPALKNSWEDLIHDAQGRNKLILCRDLRSNYHLIRWIPQRAIGAVYQTRKDRQVYVPSIMPLRYDAFLFFDHTSALHALNTMVASGRADTLSPEE